MKEEWLFPGAVVPVDVETTAALVAEIKRLIDVVGGLILKKGPDYERGFIDGMQEQMKRSVDKAVNAMSQPQQEPVAWKLVPKNPTYEMLKAMDECSTEGYDERLYAGHAASVYMAAVDVAPTPPQRKEPEPVVWMYQDKSTHEVRFQKHMRGFVDHGATYETPLYTTPPQRTWVGLTDEELSELSASGLSLWALWRAIEAKLKGKNA